MADHGLVNDHLERNPGHDMTVLRGPRIMESFLMGARGASLNYQSGQREEPMAPHCVPEQQVKTDFSNEINLDM